MSLQASPTPSGVALDSTLAALLLLADGRFPAGGHVHSGGVEAAVADGRLANLDDLAAYVTGRLHTTGLIDAALSAATVISLDRAATAGSPPGPVVAIIDAEADARLGARPLRDASRRLGRQLARAAGGCWPGPALGVLSTVHHDGPHQSVALGAVAHCAGITAPAVAALSLHHAVTTPLQAALRLCGLDPFAVAALAASLAPTIAVLAAEAAEAGAGPLEALPCAVGPLSEIAAIEHHHRASRLFAT